MKIKDVYIANAYVTTKASQIDLSEVGIYILRGKNGSGKSTFIRELLFHNSLNIEMNTSEQQKAYLGDRTGLFAYVPQDIIAPPGVNVTEYVKKNNSQVNADALASWVKKFGMSDIDFKTKVSSLSGGERTKLAIISAILKEAPYVILDEPTNNLYNGSVELLRTVLQDAAKTRSIIIVTHDERLFLEDVSYLEIKSDGSIEQEESVRHKGGKNILDPNKSVSKSLLGVAASLQKSIPNVISHVIVLLLFILIFLLSYFQFQGGYAPGDVIPDEKILIYSAEYSYGELNDYAAEGLGITIPNEKMSSLVAYEDVEEIAKMTGVESILLFNMDAFDAFLDSVSQRLDEELSGLEGTLKPQITSIPDSVPVSFYGPLGLSQVFVLEKGRAPQDASQEICMSRDMLQDLGYSADLDQNISYLGKDYTLVGMTVYDIVWVSFSESTNEQGFFYVYNKETFDDYKNKALQHAIEEDHYFPNNPSELIIETSKGMEKEVLQSLFKDFPANNFLSKTYDQAVSAVYNKPFILIMLVESAAFVVLILSSWYAFFRKTIEDDSKKISDYENYYIADGSIKKAYMATYLFVTLLGFALAFILFSQVVEKGYELLLVITTVQMLVFITVQAFLLWKGLKLKEMEAK